VRTRVPSAALFLIILGLLCGLLAGCGGGGEDQPSGNGEPQGGGQQQQGGDEQQQGGDEQQAAGEADGQGASQEKIALGTIESVDPESRKVVLKPDFEAQGGDQITFNVRKNAEIRVEDQEAELSDVQQGQSAQIEYVTKNEINRALAVEIVGGG
jgi:hypothetical protein